MRQSNEDGSTLQRPMIVWGGCCPVKEDCYSTMGLWGSHVFLPLRSGYGTHLTTPLQKLLGHLCTCQVKTIPEKDMDTLETLWQENSNGKFGFVQQRKIWRQVRGQFDKFAEKVSWFTATWHKWLLMMDLCFHDTSHCPQAPAEVSTSHVFFFLCILFHWIRAKDTWKNRNWPDEFIYNVEAPVGHLPLTNCIRGAQVSWQYDLKGDGGFK